MTTSRPTTPAINCETGGRHARSQPERRHSEIRRFAAATAVLALACVALPSFAHAEADVTPPVLVALTLPVTGADRCVRCSRDRLGSDHGRPERRRGLGRTDCVPGGLHAHPDTHLPPFAFRCHVRWSLRPQRRRRVRIGRTAAALRAARNVARRPSSLADCAGNTRDLRRDDLAAAGFPSTFTIRGEGDSTPPRLQGTGARPAVRRQHVRPGDDHRDGHDHGRPERRRLPDRATTCVSQAGPVSSVAFRSPSGNRTVGNLLRRVER